MCYVPKIYDLRKSSISGKFFVYPVNEILIWGLDPYMAIDRTIDRTMDRTHMDKEVLEKVKSRNHNLFFTLKNFSRRKLS